MIDFMDEVIKRKEDILADIKTLCQIPSVLDESTITENAPFGVACREALDAMLCIGKRDGLTCLDVDGYAGHIDIGSGDDVFGILGHLDVVPCQENGWDTEPYDMTIRNNKLYGRGVADDKGPLIAGYYAAKIIKELNLPTKMKTRVIFGCNEENGSRCMQYYFTKQPFPLMGFTPDADFPVVYGEKANANFQIDGHIAVGTLLRFSAGTRANVVPEVCKAVVKGELKKYQETFAEYLEKHDLKGQCQQVNDCVHFELVGKAAHGSTPEDGKNAATYMCHYFAASIQHPLIELIDHYFHDDHYGQKLGVAYSGHMGPLTVNLGVVRYENEHLDMVVDMRIPHELTADQIVTPVKHIVDQYALKESHHIGEALFIDPKSQLVQSLHNAYVDVTGDQVHQPQTIGGGTYAKSMPNCVGFGVAFPGTDNKIHQNNEEIAIDDILKATAIYAKALYDLIKA